MRIKTNDTNVILESAYSMEELALVERFAPQAMSRFSHDGKSMLFTVAVATSEDAGVNSVCMAFGKNSALTGKAVIELPLPMVEQGKLKNAIVDKVGAAVIHARIIEAQIAEALHQIREDNAIVSGMIEIPNELTEEENNNED